MNNVAHLPDWANERMTDLEAMVVQLLSSPPVPLDEQLRGRLPESHGIYSICAKSAVRGEVLRAGRTKSAAGGLRQRIYQNHCHGNQKGNLRAQLVQQGVCQGMAAAKPWIRANCVVQYLVVEDDDLWRWAEYMMLAVLRQVLRSELTGQMTRAWFDCG
jgi:hypothetical protein